MHRIKDKSPRMYRTGKARGDAVRLSVPENLELKMLRIAGKTRIPKGIVATEAIKRGMEILTGN